MPQEQAWSLCMRYGLIGYNLLIAHVDTPNRLRQRQEIGLQDCALAYSLREAICIGGEHE